MLSSQEVAGAGRWFYVYGLVDPRTDTIFYIGKGKGNRTWQHADRVRCGRSSGNARKDEVIAQLHAEGLEPSVKIIAEYDDQADAFEHEIELIAQTPGLSAQPTHFSLFRAR